MRRAAIWLAAAFAIIAAGCGDESAKNKTEKEKNAKPAASGPPNVTAADLAVPPDPFLAKGREVWLGTCQPCHGTGLGGAPLIGSRGQWEPRIAQGLDTLYAHALRGFSGKAGDMPARGGNEKLGDDEVKAAVAFMTSVGK